MNNEMWKEIEFRLFELRTVVKLKADDYCIWLINQRKGNKLYTVVYVDGKFKIQWINEECEIRRKFMCPSKKCLLTKKVLNKIRSKKRRKEISDKYTYISYSPYWSSFSRMKKHFIENNNEITMIGETENDTV